ncbi:MAG: hypothetical protein QMD10_10930 [Desulfitobacteriaceae bacterium]|nr:hypothetical protein [Desulfitobacteriaceae bacterium]
MDVWLVAFLGIWLGCFSRLLLPYLRKARENPQLKFDPKYLVTFAVSLIMALIASIVVMASFTIPETAGYTVFFSSFLTGWAATDILNEITATGEHKS